MFQSISAWVLLRSILQAHMIIWSSDGGDLQATRALDIHEEAVRGLHQALELVLLLLVRGTGVEKVILNLHETTC